MQHPNVRVSLAHEAFVSGLDRIIEHPGTPDEHRLAELLRDIYTQVADQPVVEKIITAYASSLMEKGD